MATIAKLYAEFGAKDSGLNAFLDKAATRLDKTEAAMKRVAKIGLGLGAALVAGLGVASYALLKAADNAAETDTNIGALESALRRAGVAGARAAAVDFSNFATQIQRSSRFTDDMVLSAAALGTRLGVPANRLREVSQAAADFAQGSGQSLQDAFTDIVKAGNGQVAMLQRSGLKFDEAKLKAGGLDAVLQLLNSHYAGSAADSVENYAGRWIVVGHAFDDVVKSIGSVISQSPIINATLVVVAETLYKLQATLDDNHDAMNDWVSTGFEIFFGALRLSVKLVELLAKGFAAFKVAGNLAIAGVIELFRGLVDVIGINVKALYEVATLGGRVHSELGDKLKGVTDRLADFSQSVQDTADVFNSTAQDGLDMWDDIDAGAKAADEQLAKFHDRILKVAKTIRTITPPNLMPIGLGNTGGPGVGSGAGAGLGAGLSIGIANFGKSLEPFLASLTETVKGFARNAGKAGSIMSGAEAGAAGGPIGMLVSAFASLIEMSQGFQNVMARLDPIVQAFADSLGMLFQDAVLPLVPTLRALANVVRPLIAAFEPLFRVIIPLVLGVPILTVGLKALSFVVHQLFDAIRTVALGILKAIKWVADKLGIHISGLNGAIADLTAMTYDSASAINGLGDAANQAADALQNIPEFFKYALRKFEATLPSSPFVGNGAGGLITPGGTGGSGSTQAYQTGGGDTYHFHFPNVRGGRDAEEFSRELERIQRRKNTSRGGALVPVG